MNCNGCNQWKTRRPDCDCQIIASLVQYRLYDAGEIKEILKVLREMTSDRFFGVLAIKFESGHIAHMKKTEFIKL